LAVEVVAAGRSLPPLTVGTRSPLAASCRSPPRTLAATDSHLAA